MTTVRIGMMGTDIMHAFEYTSIVNCASNDQFPMVAMKPLDARMEAHMATIRPQGLAQEPPPLTGADLKRDSAMRDARVVCWWSDDSATAQRHAARLGVAEVVASPAEVFRRTEAVWICTKLASTHFSLAKAALQAGRHVFVDKPFTATKQEALELLDLAESRGLIIASSSPWRWAPALQALKRDMVALGSLRSVVCSAPAIDGAFYLTHSADVVDELLGPGAGDIGIVHSALHDSIAVDYPDGRRALINGMRDIGWVRHVAVFGERGYLETEITNAQRDHGKVELVRRFVTAVSRGQWPLERRRMEDVMTIITEPPIHERGAPAAPRHTRGAAPGGDPS